MCGILRSMLLAVAMSIMAVGAAMASTGGSAFSLPIVIDVRVDVPYSARQKPTHTVFLTEKIDHSGFTVITSPLREVAASGTEPALY